MPVIPGASPWIYVNASAGAQIVVLLGGTIIETDMDVGLGFVLTLLSNFTLFPGQRIQVTYLVAPTVMVTQL